jgi:hypothetical protein
MRNAGQGWRDRMALDRDTVALILAGLTLFGALVFPRVLPAARNGPQCIDLAAPLGGNNRSVLAYINDQSHALDMILALDSPTIVVGESLAVRVTFANGSSGPMILHLNRESPILTANAGVQGVTFEITRVGPESAVPDQPRDYQPPSTFTDSATLHLLGSRARCNQEYVISGPDLAALGIQAGEYRIRAIYRNTASGVPIQRTDATATPFPEYVTSQGVWTGDAESNEIRFTIVNPG